MCMKLFRSQSKAFKAFLPTQANNVYGIINIHGTSLKEDTSPCFKDLTRKQIYHPLTLASGGRGRKREKERAFWALGI